MTEPTPAAATTPTPTPTATTTPAPNPTPVEFSAEQQAEIDRRIAAARRKAEQDAKDAAATAAAEAEARAKAEADIKANEAKGDYEAARALIEKERDEARAESAAHKERYDAAIAAIEPGVTKEWADLPEEVTALYAGAEDDVLAKAAHIQRTKPLVAKLTITPAPRIGITPRPNGSPDANDEEARRAQARSYRDF